VHGIRFQLEVKQHHIILFCRVVGRTADQGHTTWQDAYRVVLMMRVRRRATSNTAWLAPVLVLAMAMVVARVTGQRVGKRGGWRATMVCRMHCPGVAAAFYCSRHVTSPANNVGGGGVFAVVVRFLGGVYSVQIRVQAGS
jgi:hypothetical protein